MASKNLFSGILLAKDPFALDGIRKLFAEYGVELHRAQAAAEVDEWVRGRRLDLALCDYDVPGAPDLECLQANTKWRGISMVLVSGRQARYMRGKRIHFTVAKPFNLDVLAKGLRASYSSMATYRFAAYRHALALKPLAGTLQHRGLQRALSHTSIANLSQTGLCLAGPEPLPQGGTVSVNFSLPGSEDLLHLIGTIIWSDASGKSGVRFNRVSADQQKRLQQSLKARMPGNLGFLAPPE
ncbi:MAG TPA: PilZ domain-containing protein [Candidatus Angelobacter sp.]|nr:PilZ domain-containing protein [Candidatus Angelobacter sp.]